MAVAAPASPCALTSPRKPPSGSVIACCVERYGRLDVLHNNVGISSEGGDAAIDSITEEAFDRVHVVNLRGMAMTCKQRWRSWS